MSADTGWAETFYSRTGRWWGAAESAVGPRDLRRVDTLHRFAGTAPLRVLELGAGYANTAIAMARAGHDVTAVELTDRLSYADHEAADLGTGALSLVRGDFMAVTVSGRFDVVTYWNGFGVGTDAEQRTLLGRVSGEWLADTGTALIDVANPLVWSGWDGDEEHRSPDPELGYSYELHERTVYDPVRGAAVDTWWEADRPQDAVSQTLRCYQPADLRLLLEGTGLALRAVAVGDETLDPSAPAPGHAGLLRQAHEYVAVLEPDHS